MSYRVAIMVNAEQCAILVDALETYAVWEYNAAQQGSFPELREEVSRIMAKFPAVVVTPDQQASKESDLVRSKTGVCTFPCSGPQDCTCSQEEAPRTVRRVVKRKRGK